MNKRYLIVGDPHSFWNRNFITNMLQPYGYQIDIFYTYIGSDRKDIFSQQENVHVYCCPRKLLRKKENASFSSKIHTTLCILYCLIWSIKNRNKYDIINVQFVSLFATLCAKFLVGKKSKLILSYWGSDLLRIPDKELWYMHKMIKKADRITFDNVDLQYRFIEIYGDELEHISSVSRFGLPILDEIKQEKEFQDREEIYQKMGLSPQKMVVAVGYAARADQQHFKVLEQIEKLPQEYKDRIQIVLQLTYPINKEYTDKLENYVKTLGCESKLIMHEMTDSEVADLRIITDIFINAQTTDAFSGTICENLYSDTLLINAEWLRYAEFEENPFQFVEFQKFEEIPCLLEKSIENNLAIERGNNADLVWNLRSWEKCRENWTKIFKALE